MIVQGYVWLALGVALGLCAGFPWGRWNGGKALDRAWDDGWKDGHRDGWHDARMIDFGDVPRPVAGSLVSDGRGQPAIEPGHHDWQEQIEAELAPEALAAIPPAQDKAWRDMVALGQEIELDVPELGEREQRRPPPSESPEIAPRSGLGHPSPYDGALTPAQRRRDKHKHRGQYAPAQQGWTTDPDHVLASHWKPEGDRWMAEWRIEWQDDVAAVDEEIADWSARQRAWLAADRWDRGARRLGAVA